MASFDSGQATPALRDTYRFWIDENQGREVINFVLSRESIATSVGFPHENHGSSVNDYFTNVKNRVFIKSLLISIKTEEEQGLPTSTITNFCLQDVFKEDYNAVDFNQALAAIDYIHMFENSRNIAISGAMQRLGISDAQDWRYEYPSHPVAETWFVTMDKREAAITTIYMDVLLDLRFWTMIHESRRQPLHKADFLAMLNTLYPPYLRKDPYPKIITESMQRQRQSFYKLMYSIAEKGTGVIHEFIAKHLRSAIVHSWVETRSRLERYFDIGARMIEQSEKVYGVQYFTTHSHNATSVAPPTIDGGPAPPIRNDARIPSTKRPSNEIDAITSFRNAEDPQNCRFSNRKSNHTGRSNTRRTQIPQVLINFLHESVCPPQGSLRPSRSPQRYDTSAHPSVSGTWGPRKYPPNNLEFLHAPYEPHRPTLKNKASSRSIIEHQETVSVTDVVDISHQSPSTLKDKKVEINAECTSATRSRGSVDDRPALKKKKSFALIRGGTTESDQASSRSISESSNPKRALKKKVSLSAIFASKRSSQDCKEEQDTRSSRQVSMEDQVRAVRKMESLKDDMLERTTSDTPMAPRSHSGTTTYYDHIEASFPRELQKVPGQPASKKPSKADLKSARLADIKLEKARQSQLARAKANVPNETDYAWPNKDTAEPCVPQIDSKKYNRQPVCVPGRPGLEQSSQNSSSSVPSQGQQAALAMGYSVANVSPRPTYSPFTDTGTFLSPRARDLEHLPAINLRGQSSTPKQGDRTEYSFLTRKTNSPERFFGSPPKTPPMALQRALPKKRSLPIRPVESIDTPSYTLA
ncbi:hypothetical protein F5884DRAFT_24236 [Xylogone sp. PMI_703]|nr:hypothetical protein F5884DRAFT_24236 [Xylogone sp. PMI_703]